MKHNVMKRTLAGVMAVLTVAAYMPANVGGFLTEGNGIGIVASADGEATEVNSFEALKTAFETGGSYKLTNDITISEKITVAADKNVTLDLNGHSITHTADYQVIVNGNYTIIDSVENSNGVITVGAFGGYWINDSGVMTVNSGHIHKTAAGNYLIRDSRSANSTAKLVINGGTIEMDSDVNNSMIALCGTIEVHGGLLSCSGQALKGEETSTVIIDGGTLQSTANVSNVPTMYSYGTTTISGGTFTASDPEVKTCIWALTYQNYESTMNIIGGTIDNVVVSKDGRSDTTATPSVSISGGTIGSVYLKEDEGSLSITGGTFSTDVSAYVAEDYMQDEQGNVIAKSDYNWVLKESKTYTLEEDMVCKTITVPNGVNATIDMNGHTLTVNQRVNVGEGSDESADPARYGELTVKNGTLNSSVYLNWYSKMTVNGDAKVISDKNSTLLVKAYSTLDVYGTVETTKSGACAIVGWGNKKGAGGTKSHDSVLNIYNGARIICVNDNAIQHPQDGTINMYGGYVCGNTGIYAKGGNINISGGTVEAVGDANGITFNDNGSNTTGDALVIEASYEGYAGVSTVKITGGSFISEKGNAVAKYSAPNSPYSVPVGFITGGTFNTSLDTSYIAEGYEQESSGKVSKTKPVVAEKLCTITTRFASNDPYTTDIYSVGDYVVAKAGYLDGMEFIGWCVDGFMYYSESDAQTAIDERIESKYNFTVEVVYEKIEKYYTLSVEGKSDAQHQVSDLIKVKADEATYGQKFSHWEKLDGDSWKTVSYNETYSFYMPSSNVQLRAMYVDEEVTVEEKATAVIESITTNNSTKKVSFVSVINVPQNCRYVKGGLVATSDSSIGANVNADNAAYVKLSTKANVSTKNLKYTWTKSNATANWYVRGYVVYKDSKGVEHTVYSTAVCANSSGIVNLS